MPRQSLWGPGWCAIWRLHVKDEGRDGLCQFAPHIQDISQRQDIFCQFAFFHLKTFCRVLFEVKCRACSHCQISQSSPTRRSRHGREQPQCGRRWASFWSHTCRKMFSLFSLCSRLSSEGSSFISGGLGPLFAPRCFSVRTRLLTS